MSETTPEASVFLAEMRKHVGAKGVPTVARHPVNEVMIAHWADAIGDDNPCYVDPDFAQTSVHKGIVAPPAMLDVWDRHGLKTKRSVGPRGQVTEELEAAGFISVVAVTSELEIARYVRPGEVLQNVESLEEVSEEKHTGLGIGHFVTTRHRYTNQDGEHVGDLLFRILKFKAGTGRTAPASKGRAAPPDPSPSLRPRPAINKDNLFFWEGARSHELRIQKCNDCKQLCSPPSPRCPNCGSFDRAWIVSKGKGKLYSVASPHFPQVPGFSYPVVVGLVELAEGTRIVANLVGVSPEQAKIGMDLELTWLDSHPALVEGATDSRGPISLPQFRPTTPVRREDTRTSAEVGETLAPWVLPITATLIVSGAIATRDYQDVHHDRDLAHAKGSADIFLNINTSIGLMQRYVTDWAGPEAIIKALRIRLGAPAYANDTLSFSGSVKSHDPETGETVVAVRAVDSLGDHVSGTIELVLPGGSR